MKKYTITNARKIEKHTDHLSMKEHALIEGDDDMQINDGYHTMDELYEHRITLFIALCKYVIYNDVKLRGLNYSVWRSKLHSDGSEYKGWFLLGINKKPGEMISYHLPLSKWDEIGLAETLEKAPEFDGHTSEDVLKRLKYL
jgi:hypothetical protein